MAKYLLIYNTPAHLQEQMAQLPKEQQAEGMKQWMIWNDRVGEKMIDLGAPTSDIRSVNGKNEWQSVVTEASGYSIVEAENEGELNDILEGHPHTSWSDETSIEVHPCINM